MDNKIKALILGGVAITVSIGVVGTLCNYKGNENSLSVDTTVYVDSNEDTNTEIDWVQIQKENLPYQADGDLYIAITEDSVMQNEDLHNIEVEDLKEILEVDEETGFTVGITQGNNVVTVIPEEHRHLFEVDIEEEVVQGSTIAQGSDRMNNIDLEAGLAELEANANSTYGSHINVSRE